MGYVLAPHRCNPKKSCQVCIERLEREVGIRLPLRPPSGPGAGSRKP